MFNIYRYVLSISKGQLEAVIFAGIVTNHGFLKLFPELTLADKLEHAGLVIIPTDKHFITPSHTSEVFKALVGRKRMIISNRWVTDSVMMGNLQDKTKYVVKGTDKFGRWGKTENYSDFEYQIGNGRFVDITVDGIRHMLNAMVGESSFIEHQIPYIYVQMMSSLHQEASVPSDHCVSKEWIFQCITDGVVLSTGHFLKTNSTVDSNYISESDAASSVVSFKGLKEVSNITVQTTRSKSGQKVIKMLCCVYCETLTPKLARHCETFHSTELEVARALSLPKKSAERRRAWAKLAAKGSYVHNSEVKIKGSGVLIPKYRPRKTKKSREYLSCEFCKAEIVSTVMWKHHKACPSKESYEKSDAPVKNSRLLLPIDRQCSEEFRKNVLNKMKNDIITVKVKTDPLIIQFGERKYERTGKHAHTHQYISQKLRVLGRLVLSVTEMDSHITKLSQCLSAQKWELLLDGIKHVANYDKLSQTFSKPSLAQKLGHYLKKCAKIVKNNARKLGENETAEVINDFLEVYDDEWTDRIGSQAFASQADANYNKVQRLPLVQDVQKLNIFIKKQIQQTIEASEPDDIKLTKLSKLCLADIILFNRKRSGEAQRLTSDAYTKATSADTPVDEDVKGCLTKFEQSLCENHMRIETRGKKGRKVAVLLTNDMKENIDYMLSLKNENTEFIFQSPNTRFPMRGTAALRKVALEAGLNNPSSITSTSLRKQLATLSQLLNLGHNDQDVLAKFMGHDINVHREYYRLPQSTLEIAKVSKVLHAINSGTIGRLQGKDLDEIDTMEPLEAEQPSSDDDDDDDNVDHEEEDDNHHVEGSLTVCGSISSSTDSDDDFIIKKKKTFGKKRTAAVRTPWSQPEKAVVENGLKSALSLIFYQKN
ncbi:uncharacterized protein LOC128235921 [Mya arenaria]|uniref:uncharacterized protein LOC128235921 n=1 Tax=Mya arenaria TaxID=6604 RepID=UPI0022E48B2E|nr:uncharacterized protein LOC128235921 [Mya arenaria]